MQDFIQIAWKSNVFLLTTDGRHHDTILYKYVNAGNVSNVGPQLYKIIDKNNYGP